MGDIANIRSYNMYHILGHCMTLTVVSKVTKQHKPFCHLQAVDNQYPKYETPYLKVLAL